MTDNTQQARAASIPDAAIEAAAKAAYEIDERIWESAHPETQEKMRAAIKAAAPHIRGQALEDAAEDFESSIGVAEFDELSRRDGTYWAHIEDAWEQQGPYMDWLRARAANERRPNG